MACETTHFLTVIPLSVAPVVIISACGLLCLAFYNRLSFLVTRLRSFQKESLEHTLAYEKYLEENKKESKDKKKILFFIQEQIDIVMKRANLIRFCLVFLILGISSEVLTCLMIGIGSFYVVLQSWILIPFLLGLVCLFVALMAAINELLYALHPVKIENKFVKKLLKEKLLRDE